MWIYLNIRPVTDNFYSMVDHKSVRLFPYAVISHCFTFIHHDHFLQIDILQMTERWPTVWQRAMWLPSSTTSQCLCSIECLFQQTSMSSAWLLSSCPTRILYWTSSGIISFDMSLNMRPSRSDLSLPTSVWNKFQSANTDFNYAMEHYWWVILDWESWWCCSRAFMLVEATSRASCGAVKQLRVWQRLLYVMSLERKSASVMNLWCVLDLLSTAHCR